MASPKTVAVVGAGISGLAAAYYLKKESAESGSPLEIHLLERSERLGGVIHTERSDGFVFEWGPENFVAFKPEAVRLVKELGLDHELMGSNDDLRKTYVVNEGALQPLPDGMAFLAPVRLRPFWSTPLISSRGKLRAAFEPLIPRSRGDLTVRTFLERRLGRELTQKVAEPLVSAIYGGDISQLSITSALSDTHRIEQRYGSLWNGLRKGQRRGAAKLPFFVTLRSGMETLVAGLCGSMGGVEIHTGVRNLEVKHTQGKFQLAAEGHREAYDSLILSIPASAAADLIRSLASHGASALDAIHYSSTSLVYLGYKRSEFDHPLDGFGFVTPQAESEVLDACTWASTKFDGRCPPDFVLLRCAIHDGRRRRAFASDMETVERVHGEVSRLLGVSCRPALFHVRHLGPSMPQMTLGHETRLKTLRDELGRYPGLYMTGPFYNGVGIPDCIRSAQATVKQVLAFLGGEFRAAPDPVSAKP